MHQSRGATKEAAAWSVEVATSAFQLLQLMHHLQPHVALHARSDADHLSSRALGLLVHPLAWMPIDSDARARASIIGAPRISAPCSPLCFYHCYQSKHLLISSKSSNAFRGPRYDFGRPSAAAHSNGLPQSPMRCVGPQALHGVREAPRRTPRPSWLSSRQRPRQLCLPAHRPTPLWRPAGEKHNLPMTPPARTASARCCC